MNAAPHKRSSYSSALIDVGADNNNAGDLDCGPRRYLSITTKALVRCGFAIDIAMPHDYKGLDKRVELQRSACLLSC